MAEASDLMRRIARVGGDIDPALSDRDVERLVEGARLRRRRRAIARVGLGAVAAGVAAVVAVVVMHGRQPGLDLPGTPGALRLADGSLATPLDEASALSVREDAPQRVAIDLARGRGRFEVARRPERQFRVRAGDVTITVIGTVFTVERVADRIGVSVARGKVLVEWGAGSRRLAEGESGWFPPLVTARADTKTNAKMDTDATAATDTTEDTDATATAEVDVDTDTNTTTTATRSTTTSRATFASRPAGTIRSAGTSRAATAAPAAVETAESLLAAADAERLKGRAAEGAGLLRRILREHRSDPRAPLAAFTLGRVLLMELGQPRQAAAAFAEARALAPAGPFAEDALAREVEAWAKAGDKVKARARAHDYLRSYPSGRRVPAVQALGGGE